MTQTLSVAETLPELMGRMTLRLGHYVRAHDYVRIMLLGLAIFIIISFVNPIIPPFILLVMLFVFSSSLLDLYRFAPRALEREFFKNTIPFFLNRWPSWTYNLHAEGFPHLAFKQAEGLKSFFDVSHVLKGALPDGTSVVMANIVLLPHKKKLFVSAKDRKTGWVLGLERVVDSSALIGLGPLQFSQGAGWTWLFMEAPLQRYGAITLATKLNEAQPYEKVDTVLTEMFGFLEAVLLKSTKKD